MIDFIEIFNLEINKIMVQDQLSFGLALISPFCGLCLGIIFHTQSNRFLNWLMSFMIPIGWMVGFGYLLLQLPSQQIRLLIVMYGISLVLTAIYLLCMFILSSSEGLDWIKKRHISHQKDRNNIRPEA